MAQAMQTQGLDINVIHLRLLEGESREAPSKLIFEKTQAPDGTRKWRFDIRFDTKHQWLSSISFQNSPEELMGSIRILKIFQPYVIVMFIFICNLHGFPPAPATIAMAVWPHLHTARFGIHDAQQHVQDGRLPSAGATADADLFLRLDLQAEAIQNLGSTGGAEMGHRSSCQVFSGGCAEDMGFEGV